MIPTNHLTPGFWDYAEASLDLAKDIFVPESVRTFTNSVFGSQVVRMGKAAASDFVGATLGAFFPEGMIAYSATQRRGWSRTASTATGIATIVFSKYVTSWTGLSISNGWLTTAASIAGGYEGRQIAGAITPAEGVTNTYAARCVQGLVGRGIVQIYRDVMPIPAPIALVTSVFGGSIKILVGSVFVNAQELSSLAIEIYDRQPVANVLYPDRIVRAYANQTSGNAFIFVQDMTDGLGLPFLSVIQGIIGKAIDKETGVKVFVRCFNEYAERVRDPHVVAELQRLNHGNKAQIRQAVYSHLFTNQSYFRQMMSWATTYVSDDQITQGTDMMCKMYEEMVGIRISSEDRALLELHIYCFLPFVAAAYTKSGFMGIFRSELPLDPQEVQNFYTHISRLMIAPTGKLGRWMQNRVEAMIPRMLASDRLMPVFMSRVMHSLADTPPQVEVLEDDLLTELGPPKLPQRRLGIFSRLFAFIAELISSFRQKVNHSPIKPRVRHPRPTISRAEFSRIGKPGID